MHGFRCPQIPRMAVRERWLAVLEIVVTLVVYFVRILARLAWRTRLDLVFRMITLRLAFFLFPCAPRILTANC